jgi:hypothetical protein
LAHEQVQMDVTDHLHLGVFHIRRKRMVRQLITVLVVALCVGADVTTAQPQPSRPIHDTFIWSGPLVSVDAGSGTVTVRAPILSDAAREVARFNPGDQVLLTWSGYELYADAIRQIAKIDGHEKATEPFSLPVELVSRELQNDYVTFRFKAPSTALSVTNVKPGEWVTVTARHGSSPDSQRIVSVEPFVKSST